jgi:hypothetical protein
MICVQCGTWIIQLEEQNEEERKGDYKNIHDGFHLLEWVCWNGQVDWFQFLYEAWSSLDTASHCLDARTYKPRTQAWVLVTRLDIEVECDMVIVNKQASMCPGLCIAS